MYRKREAVFGLYQARQALRTTDRAVLVEGNFDVLSLHARGIKNVVAPLGTAFTVEQARTIRRFTPNVTLLFDPDEAGRRAVRVGARRVPRGGPRRVGGDARPREWTPTSSSVRRARSERGLVIDAAQPIIAHLMEERLDENFKRNDPATQARKIQEVIELIKSEDDPTLRALAEQHADRARGPARTSATPGRLRRSSEASRQSRFAGRGTKVRARKAAARAPAPGPLPRPTRGARARDPRRAPRLSRSFWTAQRPNRLPSLLDGDVAMAPCRTASLLDKKVSQNPEVILAKTAAPIHAFALARWAAPQHETLGRC